MKDLYQIRLNYWDMRNANMNINEIAQIINNNGGRLYYVGGCVRDRLMNIPSKDIDCCLVGMTSEKFVELFPNAFRRGSFFPVFDLNGYEIALARKEEKVSEGHQGFNTFTENVSLEEDLIRRDITINSIAIDILTGEVIDPFNGQEDIKNSILRATSEHFIEDPLRVYRVAQFASRLSFSIDKDTLILMKSMKDELNTISVERVFEELKKALYSSKPSVFFDVLRYTDLLDIHFKEINDLIGVIQPIEYHPEGDAYNHSMIVMDKVAEITDDIKVRWAALLHDLGKGITPKEILPHHYQHDINGVEVVRNLCNRLKLPKEWTKLAVAVAKEHMRAGLYDNMKIPKKVAFLEKNYKYLNELELIAQVDSKKSNLQFAEIGKKMIEQVNGNIFTLPNNETAKEILHNKRIEWFKREDA